MPRLYVLMGSYGKVTVDNTLHFREMLAVSNVDFYQVQKCFLTSKLVRQVQAKGKKIIAWGVKPKDIDRMLELGVDMVEVDYPELFR